MDYLRVEYAQPHIQRMREMIRTYPQIRELFGPNPMTFVWTSLLVVSQFALAYALRDVGIWGILALAFCVGAFIDHALFGIVHEASHNLIFKTRNANRFAGVFANFPAFLPAAIGFRNHHLLHHMAQGEMGWDADLAGPKEAAWVGNRPFRKFLSMLFFAFVQGMIRPIKCGKINVLDGWTIFNALTSVGLTLAAGFFWGWMAAAYLIASSFFAVGLHPLGGRWIQEHYLVAPPQETYSYYGPLNKLCFNLGYHNEHHDFMMIPWNKLPKLKAIAPEYYNSLHFHTSWTKLLLTYIFDERLSPYSRVVRPDHDKKERKVMNTNEAEDWSGDFELASPLGSRVPTHNPAQAQV